MKDTRRLFKKYGIMFFFTLVGSIIISIALWPISWFILFMFNDEKNEDKLVVLKRMKIVTTVWTIVFFIAVLGKLIADYIFPII